MGVSLDPAVHRRLRDRQGLLWVCQRFDLREGESPHDLSTPADAARARYRSAPTDTDRDVGQLYWEAVWLEGANSPLLGILAAQGKPDGGRPSVVLAGPDDAEANFSEHQFQPVAVLPGRLDLGAEGLPGHRYGDGGSKQARQRKKVAESLARRLVKYPHRVLVVLGAESTDDLLEYLYPTLEDNPITDLDLVVLHPSNRPAPDPPDCSAVRYHTLAGTASELVDALHDLGAPPAAVPVGWSVRMKHPGRDRTAAIALTADVVQRVTDQFELITEQDLRPPERFSLEDLISFLDGSPGAWAGYAAGLPVPRAYRTAGDRSLIEEFVHSLRTAELAEPGTGSDSSPRRRASTLVLPTRGGAGATTLVRAAAYAAASLGYPTLVARPGVTDIDFEMLTAFATGLAEAAFSGGFESIPPTAVVLDVELAETRSARQLAGIMAAKGRPAVVLRVVPAADDAEAGDRLKPGSTPRVLEGRTHPSEVASCQRVFAELVSRWQLPIGPPPSLEDWQAYEAKTKWRAGHTDEPSSLFWVALRFFLISGLTRTEQGSVLDALGRWIRERDEKLSDPEMRRVLTWVAALSSQRLVCPLSVALRPVTGGAFSSALVPAMRALGALVDWQDFSRDLDDYALRFRHPALAQEYLRQQAGADGPETAIRTLRPLLQQLVPGRAADRWLAEQLTVHVLTPGYHERPGTDWGWRLAGFNYLPPALAAGSRAVLHHWARCLYLSADLRNSPDLAVTERRARMDQAVRLLQDAISLPRQGQREEHPSHLWNTLGVAFARRARLTEESDKSAARSDWDHAWEAFRRSIDLLPGNVDALMSFSRRLLEHAGAATAGPAAVQSPSSIDEVASALGLLDEADELLNQAQDPDPDLRADIESLRSLALNWLGAGLVEEHLAALRASDTPELGYYCQAQLVAAGPDDPIKIDQALAIMDTAAAAGPLGPRSIRLQLSLLRRHPARRFEFSRLLAASEALEQASAGRLHPVEQFRLAVLYFQLGLYPKGEDRFRRLRELERRADVTIPAVQEVWRHPAAPDSPRITRIRVSRMTNEWRGEGYVDDIGMTIPLRPRHFSPLPKLNDVVECGIRFEFRGPLAVPKRFVLAATR